MPLAKEAGWVLAIDQASNRAGVSLWQNGELVATTTLVSASPKDAIGKRLAVQVQQLEDWLYPRLGKGEIKTLIFEGVRARIVLITVGAFVCVPQLRNCKIHPRLSFVEAPAWKKYAKSKGALPVEGEIKGVVALRSIGFPVDLHQIDCDDVADSILLYLTYRDRK